MAGDRRRQPLRLDAHLDRRALAAGDDEPVQAGQLRRGADLEGVGAEPAKHGDVSLEPTLDREDADPQGSDRLVEPRLGRSGTAILQQRVGGGELGDL